MKNLPIIIIVTAVIAGGTGFFGGMKYQQGQVPAGLNRQFTGGTGVGGQRTGGRFGNGANRPVTGQIISHDANSLTVKLADGSSKIVILSASTSINKASQAAPADLTAGLTVAVFGTTNADGSVTAQNIQLNPTNMFRGQGSSPQPSASPGPAGY